MGVRLAQMFLCRCTTPMGSPVVPDVYTISTTSSGEICDASKPSLGGRPLNYDIEKRGKNAHPLRPVFAPDEHTIVFLQSRAIEVCNEGSDLSVKVPVAELPRAE